MIFDERIDVYFLSNLEQRTHPETVPQQAFPRHGGATVEFVVDDDLQITFVDWRPSSDRNEDRF
jgi:hypothetical protein